MAPLLTSASAISSRRKIVIYVAWRSLTVPWLLISTAFLLGNEGTGFSAKECAICDFFIYIPQYGVGTASLNVLHYIILVMNYFRNCAANIIQEVKCAVEVWAGFAERCRDVNKFIVAERPVKQVKRNYCPETEESITEERKCRRGRML